MNIVTYLLEYSDKIDEFIDSSIVNIENMLEEIFGESNHTFTPIRVDIPIKPVLKIYNVARVFTIIVIIFVTLLAIGYLVTILPFFEKFSLFMVKWSAVAPSIFILLLCIIGSMFTIIGGIFAFYADAGLEITLDNTINTVFDIFPKRTLDIPDINIDAFTRGAFTYVVPLPTHVFSVLRIFQKFVKEHDETSIFKALNIYKIFNVTDLIESIGTSVSSFGKKCVLPDSTKEFITQNFDSIDELIPSSFPSLFEYIDIETGRNKTSITRDAVYSAETIPENMKNQINQYLNQIDEYTQLLENAYNETMKEVKNNLKDAIYKVPESLTNIASYLFTKLGSITTETALRFDETVNQIPIKAVKGVYNIVYNALFSDIIEGTSLVSSASIITIVCIPIMLVCFLFLKNITEKRKPIEKNESTEEYMLYTESSLYL